MDPSEGRRGDRPHDGAGAVSAVPSESRTDTAPGRVAAGGSASREHGPALAGVDLLAASPGSRPWIERHRHASRSRDAPGVLALATPLVKALLVLDGVAAVALTWILAGGLAWGFSRGHVLGAGEGWLAAATVLANAAVVSVAVALLVRHLDRLWRVPRRGSTAAREVALAVGFGLGAAPWLAALGLSVEVALEDVGLRGARALPLLLLPGAAVALTLEAGVVGVLVAARLARRS